MLARDRRRSAFTLIELLVVIAVIAILIALLLGAVAGARRSARLTVCMSRMSTMGKTLGTYAATFQDRIYAFSWTRETKQSQYPDLNNHGDDLIAASDQAIDILRRRAGREDINKINNLIPHPVLTHLIAQDFLTARLPDTEVLCPEDKARNAWARDPYAFDRKEIIPYPGNRGIGAGTNFGKIWPYTSSYLTVVASFEHTPGSIVQLEDLLYLYYPAISKLGGNKIGDVVFPAQKVLTYDNNQRHYGKQPSYWAYDDVRMPLTMFDSSVRVRSVGDSNLGWDPTKPADNKPLIINYTPDVGNPGTTWQPPARDVSGTDKFAGRFSWTRGGLKGVDYGGSEINTGQMK